MRFQRRYSNFKYAIVIHRDGKDPGMRMLFDNIHIIAQTPRCSFRPDIYALDTRGGAQRRFGNNVGSTVDDDFKVKHDEMPLHYNHAVSNTTACWDPYWGRWMETMPVMPYQADLNSECVVSAK